MSHHTNMTVREISLEGTTMAYREAGQDGAPVALFLHGNPTSSFIWRDILPLVAPMAHCIAPDLIGFGQSGKPDIAYRFFDHVHYFEALIDKLDINSAYLVAQDWGSALAFHLAARRPDFVRGLAFMEFIRPMPGWADFHQNDPARESARETFQKFRTPGEGESMILDENAFIERLLPGSILRKLSDDEMAAYRAPFPTAASRRPILALPRELPIAGEPAEVYQALQSAHAALAASSYPKLLFVGEPGALVSPLFAASFAASLTNCALVPLGPGRHFLQEDHPEAIGRSVAGWIAGIEAANSRRTRQAA
ncbi:haloalkane dehalogenase [Bradyrhizobium sp.]|uniref:haloalkane dehalogenase n=1 Tax=Bradyrhizobium sp. TaxID=376 RepID=UPI003C58A186